jgi:ankyrin repeat protein
MARKGVAGPGPARMGALVLLISILLVAGGAPSALRGQDVDHQDVDQDFDKGFEQTAQLIVMIDVDYGGTPQFGAGIVFGRDGNHVLIATADHVVHRGPTQPSRIRVRFRSMRDTPVEAKVLHHGAPGEMDLAVLSVDTSTAHGFDVCTLPFARLGNASSVERRTLASPVGNPNGTRWGVPVEPDEVSSVEGNEFVFQSAVISSGDSGGGLLDGDGNLLGMTIADQPPFGRAINIDAVIKTLKQWGFPVRISPVLEKGFTPLHVAAGQGDLATVTSLLDCGGVNALDDHKATPLHYASGDTGGNTQVIALLLKAGANLEAKDADGDTPLSWAAESGHVEAVRFLLQAGAKPDSRNNKEGTVLHVAAEQLQVDVIKVLVSAHADVNALNYAGDSPLDIVGRNFKGPKAVAASKLLIAAGGKLQARSLEYTAQSGHDPDMLASLEAALPGVINLDAQVPPTGTLLHIAADSENIDTARLLLAAGAKINSVAHNEFDRTPLFLALEHGYQPEGRGLAPFLLAHGGQVRAPGTPELRLEELLQQAVDWKWKTAVEILLAAGTNPNAPEYLEYSQGSGSKFTILSAAQRDGDQEIVKLLVDAGAK